MDVVVDGRSEMGSFGAEWPILRTAMRHWFSRVEVPGVIRAFLFVPQSQLYKLQTWENFIALACNTQNSLKKKHNRECNCASYLYVLWVGRRRGTVGGYLWLVVSSDYHAGTRRIKSSPSLDRRGGRTRICFKLMMFGSIRSF